MDYIKSKSTFHNSTKETINWKIDSSQQWHQKNALVEVKVKLQIILQSLLAECEQLKCKYHEQECKYLKQIQDKDKLILSLTKINNTLLKENRKIKQASAEQIRYFSQRITELQSKSLEEKHMLQQYIKEHQSLTKNLKPQTAIKGIQNSKTLINQNKNSKLHIDENRSKENSKQKHLQFASLTKQNIQKVGVLVSCFPNQQKNNENDIAVNVSNLYTASCIQFSNKFKYTCNQVN